MRPTSISTLDPQAGPTSSVVGDTYRIVVLGEQTEGAYAIIDMQKFFQEIGQPVAAGQFLPQQEPSPTQKQQLATIAQKYGQELFLPNYLQK